MQDFKDPGIAAEWDSDTTSGNPLRPEQLDVMLAILAAVYQHGQLILDVGMGSGQVEERILDCIPDARIVGVDESEAMLRLARERLRGREGRYSIVEHDLMDTGTLTLPPGSYQAAVSVQTIHNLPDEAKRQVIQFVYDTLSPGAGSSCSTGSPWTDRTCSRPTARCGRGWTGFTPRRCRRERPSRNIRSAWVGGETSPRLSSSTWSGCGMPAS